MSQSYYISTGVLDASSARRRVPANYPPPEACVAPRDIFFDYEKVMAGMRGRNSYDDSFYDDDDDFSTDESSPKTYDDDDDYRGAGYSNRATQSQQDNQPGLRCTYMDPENRRRCGKINRSSQEAARHWRSCHLYKEAKAMLLGTLPVGRGTAITSQKQLDEVRPRIECQRCGALITRSDTMRRHLNTNCR